MLGRDFNVDLNFTETKMNFTEFKTVIKSRLNLLFNQPTSLMLTTQKCFANNITRLSPSDFYKDD